MSGEEGQLLVFTWKFLFLEPQDPTRVLVLILIPMLARCRENQGTCDLGLASR
jgi:hypothetical protein